MLLWRNRLARMTVNHEVGGSSPPGSAKAFLFAVFFKKIFPIRKLTISVLNIFVDIFIIYTHSKCARTLAYLKGLMEPFEVVNEPLIRPGSSVPSPQVNSHQAIVIDSLTM